MTREIVAPISPTRLDLVTALRDLETELRTSLRLGVQADKVAEIRKALIDHCNDMAADAVQLAQMMVPPARDDGSTPPAAQTWAAVAELDPADRERALVKWKV